MTDYSKADWVDPSLGWQPRPVGALPERLNLEAPFTHRQVPWSQRDQRGGEVVASRKRHRIAPQQAEDLLKGILTNLLENAAEAAGEGGKILGVTAAENGKVAIEVHDSGPGLSEQARDSLFQPTISFKKRGMGLGLSIARKSALLSGGDIVLVKGELGGAGFRVLLPMATNGIQTHPDRG